MRPFQGDLLDEIAGLGAGENGRGRMHWAMGGHSFDGRRVIVQKFGGSSVASADRMRASAAKAVEAAKRGDHVVVVVSARGDTTDDLIELAGQITERPDKREMDQLLATGEQVSIALMAMCLQSMGHNSISLTGAQVGIRTDSIHTRSRIQSVDRNRLIGELADGKIPIVAGFQGLAQTGDTTTLGRGGSDTTAVALAAAIDADECEIYTDVDGVYTADPRLVPNARLLETISYEEMLEAASQGAKVMHLRSVELGKKAGVPIRVLHSQKNHPAPDSGLPRGTLICDIRSTQGTPMENRQAVTTVALKTDIGRVSMEDMPNRPGIQREIFEKIAQAGVSVDDIIQHEVETGPSAGQKCNIVFTVDKPDLADVRPIVDAVLAGVGSGRARVDLGLAKVSAVGAGMQSQPGVAASMFRALADAGITIANITTSEIKVSCIIPEQDGQRALRVVHDVFGLSQPVVTTGAASSVHAASR